MLLVSKPKVSFNVVLVFWCGEVTHQVTIQPLNPSAHNRDVIAQALCSPEGEFNRSSLGGVMVLCAVKFLLNLNSKTGGNQPFSLNSNSKVFFDTLAVTHE